jgi:hypothetical protein
MDFSTIIGTIGTCISVEERIRGLVQAYVDAPNASSSMRLFSMQLSSFRLSLIQGALQNQQRPSQQKLKKANIETIRTAAGNIEKDLKEAESYLEERAPDTVAARLAWALWAQSKATSLFEDVATKLDTMQGILDLAKLAPTLAALPDRNPNFYTGKRETFRNCAGGYLEKGDWVANGQELEDLRPQVDFFVEANPGRSGPDNPAQYIAQNLWWTCDNIGKEAGLLPCIGFRKNDVIFLLPDNMATCQTLRQHMILSRTTTPPLEARFAMALQLAEAVFKLHSAGFTHRAIRSDTVLLLTPEKATNEGGSTTEKPNDDPKEPTEEEPSKHSLRRKLSNVSDKVMRRNSGKQHENAPKNDIKRPNSDSNSGPGRPRRRASLVRLFGRNVEPSAQDTNKQKETVDAAPKKIASIPPGFGSVYLIYWKDMLQRGERSGKRPLTWYDDIYRHPQQQGKEAAIWKPNMGHDIYSLGVCLLEIALWEPLAWRVTEHGNPQVSPRLVSGANSNRGKEDVMRIKLRDQQGANEVKENLVDITERKVPGRMGSRYASIVQTCLTCLDKNDGWTVNFDLLKREEECTAFRKSVLSVLQQVNETLAASL